MPGEQLTAGDSSWNLGEKKLKSSQKSKCQEHRQHRSKAGSSLLVWSWEQLCWWDKGSLVWMQSSTLLPLTAHRSVFLLWWLWVFLLMVVMGMVQPQPLQQQVLGAWPWARICAVTSVTGPSSFSWTVIVTRDPLGHTVGSEGSLAVSCHLTPSHPNHRQYGETVPQWRLHPDRSLLCPCGSVSPGKVAVRRACCPAASRLLKQRLQPAGSASTSHQEQTKRAPFPQPRAVPTQGHVLQLLVRA